MYRHYTNLDSLFHIVSSGKVWFSSLAFMNDELEGKELHKILSSVLQTKYDEQDYQNKLSLIETTIDTHLRFQLSFSSTVLDDDISQWRAYTKIGQGVAIEFDEDFITDSRAKKIDCLYDYESKREAIIEDVNLRSNDTRTNEIPKAQRDSLAP